VQGPQAPGLRQVEHLAHQGEHAIGLDWLRAQAVVKVRDILEADRGGLAAAERGQDVAPQDAFVAFDARRLLLWAGVLLQVTAREIGDGRRRSLLGALGGRVVAVRDAGEHLLGPVARLLDGECAELPEREAAGPTVPHPLDGEPPPAAGADPDDEAAQLGVPHLDLAGGGDLEGVEEAFGDLGSHVFGWAVVGELGCRWAVAEQDSQGSMKLTNVNRAFRISTSGSNMGTTVTSTPRLKITVSAVQFRPWAPRKTLINNGLLGNIGPLSNP
jgi:hypothetical protein